MKNNKGFTLIELLITLAITSVLMIISSEFLINLVNASVKVQSKNEVEQNSTFISTKLTKMLQDASTVSYGETAEMTPNNNQLIFNLNGTDYTLDYDSENSALYLNQSSLSSVKVTSAPAASLSGQSTAFKISGQNPIQVIINLKLIKDAGTKFESTQIINRIITLRKSYKY